MTLKKADEAARRGKEMEEESAKSTQGERRTMANCANRNVGEKKPLMSVMLLYFSFFPTPHTSLDRPSLFSISGGNGGTAWRSDELAGVSGRRCIRRCDNGV